MLSVGAGIMRVMRVISRATARRIALAAQGFAEQRPAATPTRRHLRKVLNRTQLFQLDSVNVAVRAHYAPLFARLGPYPFELLDDAAWTHSARKPRMLVEYWAHEASLIPVEDWPLLRFRMRELDRRYRENPDSVANTAGHLADEVRAAVKDMGPISAGALERVLPVVGDRSRGGWWNRSTVKRICEWLFAAGELSVGARHGFERLYDLPERVLDDSVLSTPEYTDSVAARELIRRSARALGIATEYDLRDYYRLRPAMSKQAVAELASEGALEPVEVRGWRDRAYVHADARAPRSITGGVLLCPFDPLVFNRGRAERLFGFSYRIEIYVPEPQRVYGYYVFPFLLDGELVARVDLKADRAAGLLRVHGAFAEHAVDHVAVGAELARELHTMAEWLGLSGVRVAERGDLARTLHTWLERA